MEPTNTKFGVDLKRGINPVVAIVIAIVVVLGVGWLSMRLFGGSTEEGGPPIIIKPAHPDDPKYRGNPNLAGSG
jgi:hypothetical protein